MVIRYNPEDFKKWLVLLAALALMIAMLTGCSAEKRLLRLQKKHPELFVTDTLTIRDTVIIAEIRTDTIFNSKPGDTVTIEKDRLQIKYVKLPGDSVWLEGKCLTDTVYRVVNVPCPNQAKVYPDWWVWMKKQVRWLWIIGIIFLIIILFRVSKKVIP